MNNKNTTGLRIVVGRVPNKDFRIELNGKDVTDQFDVKSLDFRVTGHSGPTVVNMDVYVDEVDLMPDHVQLRHIEKERQPALLRQGVDDQWYTVPETELVDFERTVGRLTILSDHTDAWFSTASYFEDRYGVYRLEGGPRDARVTI